MAKQKILLGGIVKEEVKKLNDNFNELYQEVGDISVPSKTSDLTNDSGFVTEETVTQAVNAATRNMATDEEVTSAVTNATANKVDKETGKGLSTNDYSNADKSKVGNLGKIDFTATSFGTAQADGYFYATLPAAGKYPVKVMKQNGSTHEEVIVQASVEGDNIVLCADSAFAGYVVTI
jgi:hypothetical protein